MKITAVDTLLCRLPVQYRRGVPSLAGVPRKTLDMLLVRISTDAGLVGWGEAFAHYNAWAPTRVALQTLVAPRCIGQDPLALTTLMAGLERQLHPLGRGGPVAFGLSGLEMALWDLAGKALGVPLHRLLGGAQVAAQPSYASLPRYGVKEAVVHDCEAALARGFKAVKVHEITLPELHACAAQLGPGIDFMIDANCPWTLPQALEIVQALDGVPVRWLEEPLVGPDDYASLATLRREGGMPIACGENATAWTDFATMMRLGAVDFVQPSVAKIGGVAALRRICELAHESDVGFAPHSPFLGPALLATMQVCAALAPTAPVEAYFLDVPGNPFGAVAVPQNGLLVLPDGPGLGFDPDPALLQAALQS